MPLTLSRLLLLAFGVLLVGCTSKGGFTFRPTIADWGRVKVTISDLHVTKSGAAIHFNCSITNGLNREIYVEDDRLQGLSAWQDQGGILQLIYFHTNNDFLGSHFFPLPTVRIRPKHRVVYIAEQDLTKLKDLDALIAKYDGVPYDPPAQRYSTQLQIVVRYHFDTIDTVRDVVEFSKDGTIVISNILRTSDLTAIVW